LGRAPKMGMPPHLVALCVNHPVGVEKKNRGGGPDWGEGWWVRLLGVRNLAMGCRRGGDRMGWSLDRIGTHLRLPLGKGGMGQRNDLLRSPFAPTARVRLIAVPKITDLRRLGRMGFLTRLKCWGLGVLCWGGQIGVNLGSLGVPFHHVGWPVPPESTR